jgi:hypothetical protein
MILKELISVPVGELIKSHSNFRYDDGGIFTTIITPEFYDNNSIGSKNKMERSFILYETFPFEDKIKKISTAEKSADEVISFLINKEIALYNGKIFNRFSNDFFQIKKNTPMLLGCFFSVINEMVKIQANLDLSFKLYAKVLVGDKIGWIGLNVLGENFYLELE